MFHRVRQSAVANWRNEIMTIGERARRHLPCGAVASIWSFVGAVGIWIGIGQGAFG